MHSKITITNNVHMVSRSEDFLPRLIEEYRDEPSRETLSFFVSKNIPIDRYNNLKLGLEAISEYKNQTHLTKVEIDGIALPRGVKGLYSLHERGENALNLSCINRKQEPIYTEDYLQRVIRSKLIKYVAPDYHTRMYGGTYKLVNGYENNDERIPAIVDLGQAIMGETFTPSTILDYFPKDLPETVYKEGFLTKK